MSKDDMRRYAKKWAIAALIAAMIATLCVLLARPAKNYLCWLRNSESYRALATVNVTVPPPRAKGFVQDLRDFSRKHGLLFAVDHYPAGAASIPHERYVGQAISCQINIISDNIVDDINQTDLYVLEVSSAPGERSQASVISQDLVSTLSRKYDVRVSLPESAG